MMRAIDFLVEFAGKFKFPIFHSMERHEKGGVVLRASRSELERWLQKRSVVINGKTPLPCEPVEYPIWELVLFPKGRHKTTLQLESAWKPPDPANTESSMRSFY